MIGQEIGEAALERFREAAGTPPPGCRLSAEERARLLACVTLMVGSRLTDDEWGERDYRMSIRDFLTERGMPSADADAVLGPRLAPGGARAATDALCVHPGLTAARV